MIVPHPCRSTVVVPLPGHTEGYIGIIHAGKFLFSGDMVWYSHDLGHLVGSRFHTWWDWARQIASVEELKKYQVGAALHC